MKKMTISLLSAWSIRNPRLETPTTAWRSIASTIIWFIVSVIIQVPATAAPTIEEKSLPAPTSPVDLIDCRPAANGIAGVYVCAPFGMTKWTPASQPHRVSVNVVARGVFRGFLGSHQPHVWMGDFGYVTVVPQAGDLRIASRTWAIPYQQDLANPHLGRFRLNDPAGEIGCELTATSRAAMFKIQYPTNVKARLIIEAIHGFFSKIPPVSRETWRTPSRAAAKVAFRGGATIDKDRHEIAGWNNHRMDYVYGPFELPNFKGYFVMQFDRPFTQWGVFEGDTATGGGVTGTGARCGAYAEFDPGENRIVLCKIGTSFISVDQARENLKREIPGWDFSAVVNENRQTWNTQLSRIRFDAPANSLPDLYKYVRNTLMWPSEMAEYGRYYSAFDDTVHDGQDSYTHFAFWDTFRCQFPWLMLVVPERINPMIRSLLQTYREGGWLPMWSNPSYTSIMLGTHGDSVIAEAILKGFKGFDWELAYQAIRKDGTTPPDEDDRRSWFDREMFAPYEARGGLGQYLKFGYVTSDKAESCARTLEFAYDDGCIARVAKLLGKTEDAEMFTKRSKNYRNVYNPVTGWMQAKDANGKWVAGGFAEGGAGDYSWTAMHDVRGLIELMGGADKFLETKVSMWNKNEQVIHHPYMFTLAGKPWRTAEEVRKVARDVYRNGTRLLGDDDMGCMSSWYLFACLGLYPVDPTSCTYVIGSPVHSRITLLVGEGRTFEVGARNNSAANIYVQSATLNGKPLTTPLLQHAEVVAGGILEFEMGPQPSHSWGILPR